MGPDGNSASSKHEVTLPSPKLPDPAKIVALVKDKLADDSNYHVWLGQVKLVAKSYCIKALMESDPTTESEVMLSEQLGAILLHTMTPSTQAQFLEHDTAKAVMDAVKTAYGKPSRLKAAEAKSAF